jgi:hypothetical protein
MILREDYSDNQINGDPITGMEIAYEGLQDWSNLTEAVIRLEAHAHIKEDVALLESGIKEAFQKVIAWFKKLWEKIKAWVKKAIDWISARILGTKSFLKKYEDRLLKTNVSGMKFKMYPEKITNKKITSVEEYNKVIERIVGTVESNPKVKAEVYSISSFQNEIIKAYKGKKSDSFSSSLRDALLGGEKKEYSVSSQNVKDCIDFLKSAEGVKKEIIANQKAQEALIRAGLVEAENAEKGTEDEQEKKEAWAKITSRKNAISVSQMCVSIILSVYNEVSSMSLALLRAVLTYGGKKTVKKESYNFGFDDDDTNEGDILSQFGY